MISLRFGRPPALPVFTSGIGEVPLTLSRHPRAKRAKIAIGRDGASVRLTLPPRGALGPALKWVESQRGWIEARLVGRASAMPIVRGAAIPFLGGELLLDWSAERPRSICREGERLIAGGPPEALAARVLRWLKTEALRRLTEETRALAAAHDIAAGKISVGDAQTRWGSCAASGDIRYSWRLVMAPPDVLRQVVAHELAHRRHMNHSPAFYAAVAELFGRDPAPERAWLRANGARLQGFGRGG